jgi:hypothetical protein
MSSENKPGGVVSAPVFCKGLFVAINTVATAVPNKKKFSISSPLNVQNMCLIERSSKHYLLLRYHFWG